MKARRVPAATFAPSRQRIASAFGVQFERMPRDMEAAVPSKYRWQHGFMLVKSLQTDGGLDDLRSIPLNRWRISVLDFPPCGGRRGAHSRQWPDADVRPSLV